MRISAHWSCLVQETLGTREGLLPAYLVLGVPQLVIQRLSQAACNLSWGREGVLYKFVCCLVFICLGLGLRSNQWLTCVCCSLFFGMNVMMGMCKLWSCSRLFVWIAPLTLVVITFKGFTIHPRIYIYMVLCVECEDRCLIYGNCHPIHQRVKG
jgi:hypothetical protein